MEVKSMSSLSQDGAQATSVTLKVAVALLVVFGISSFLKYRAGLKTVGKFPGLRVPFYPTGPPGVFLPTTWWNPGYHFLWARRLTNYAQFGVDTFSVVPFVFGPPAFYTANLDVLRQVAGGAHKTSFAKTESTANVLVVWGANLLSADKETWRKHRRIVAPAFNTKLYQDVWTHTLQIYQEALIAEKWTSERTIEVPNIHSITFKVALLIIAQCGFGFDFTWSDPPRSSSGQMSVQEALRSVTDEHMTLAFVPKMLLRRLPIKRFQKLYDAHQQIGEFMKAQVAQRKEQHVLKGADAMTHDIFSELVKANEAEGGKLKLDDSELIGNVFILLFAGHETTAHTLSAALGLLSVHPEIQEEIYQQIISVCGRDGEPSFEDHAKLDKVLATFYEAARLFPAAHIMLREAWEDTILHIPGPGQDEVTAVPVPKGTPVVVDMVGVQYNPRYYDDPTAFKPSRWYGVSSDSDAFLAFSVGPRACVGRKFATSEAVALLTSFLRDFEVRPLLANGETVETWKARVLDAKLSITLGVNDIPLRLVRRN